LRRDDSSVYKGKNGDGKEKVRVEIYFGGIASKIENKNFFFVF
jgi:hypothetical protein